MTNADEAPYTKVVYEYSGFEEAVDIERDMSEIFEEDFSHVEAEWQGTLRITIEYIPEED